MGRSKAGKIIGTGSNLGQQPMTERGFRILSISQIMCIFTYSANLSKATCEYNINLKVIAK